MAKKTRLLILGGTAFLGRALVEKARTGGLEVTLFNRGKTHPNLFPDIETLRGDRDGNLDALKNRRWDYCIDTCGYIPRIVAQSAQLLAEAVDHYLFISSISAYAKHARIGADETAPLGILEDESTEEITGETYGPLKVLCEKVIAQYFAKRYTIVRPGLIVGPCDPTDRFSYWPHRIAQGGPVLAPGNPKRPVQFIDVRDLAAWCVELAQAQQVATFDATGPAQPLAMDQFLASCEKASGSDAEFIWMDDAFLLAHEAAPWMELPLWIPESEKDMAGFQRRNIDKALGAGLKIRALEDTLRSTLDWLVQRPADYVWKAGMQADKERELLAAWRENSAI